MKFAADGPMAIPLWINGHAYLTVTQAFLDVRNPASGDIIRRTPLSGPTEVTEALGAGQAALSAWRSLPESERQQHLQHLARLLDQFTGHFARLVVEETGVDETVAKREVATAVTALQGTETATVHGVVAVVSDASRSLAAVAGIVAPLLRSGNCVLLKPSPRTPGAIFALAELSGRAGFPAGVINLVHGDLAVIDALCQHPDLGLLRIVGEGDFVGQVKALGERYGRSLETD
ncbi:MAG TPA: aldehyde dehydrogenase family protein [Rhodocyclaceae bacterium]|nr:aldehyde dehydrogenase family protein [Rhodocyclaceae bacterium]